MRCKITHFRIIISKDMQNKYVYGMIKHKKAIFHSHLYVEYGIRII